MRLALVRWRVGGGRVERGSLLPHEVTMHTAGFDDDKHDNERF